MYILTISRVINAIYGNNDIYGNNAIYGVNK